MRNLYKYIVQIVLTACCTVLMHHATAQSVVRDTSIVQYLERSNTGGTVKISQPVELTHRVSRVNSDEQENGLVVMPIYRIQLFSANNSNAKAQAEKLALEVEAEFPDLPLNVSYASPFWRPRAGEFHTREEAQAMQYLIQSKFPEMERGILIIRERVNVPVHNYSND